MRRACVSSRQQRRVPQHSVRQASRAEAASGLAMGRGVREQVWQQRARPSLGENGCRSGGRPRSPQVHHLYTGPTAQALWRPEWLVRRSDAEAQEGALAMARGTALGWAPWATAAHPLGTETSGAGPMCPLPKPLILGSERRGKSFCLLETAYRQVPEKPKPM